jgi:FkbM family methyltransferase
VNVGASIGEFLIVYSKYKNVEYAIGFEPIDECYKSLIISKLINNLENLEIYTSSSIKLRENAISLKKQMHKIDTLFERGIIKEEKTVVLIDVEGAEYEVILGDKNFINKIKPN